MCIKCISSGDVHVVLMASPLNSETKKKRLQRAFMKPGALLADGHILFKGIAPWQASSCRAASLHRNLLSRKGVRNAATWP